MCRGAPPQPAAPRAYARVGQTVQIRKPLLGRARARGGQVAKAFTPEGAPNKLWVAFAKRKFMNTSL